MKRISNPLKTEWPFLFRRATTDFSSQEPAVLAIMQEVKLRGDAALFDFAHRFDQAQLKSLQVSEDEMAGAAAKISDELCAAIQVAKNNIEVFHAAHYVPVEKIETMPGVICWRKSVGIEHVGLYIPGGSAPLFSTVLMLGLPAKLAGCTEISLCTPPNSKGEIHPAILYAANLCGIKRIFKSGGAQAIAAMAYGTETIPKADKIFGPGNSWVTVAKQLLAREGVAIDLPAGPSELAVFADETVPAAFIAADLLSQAEHGPDSQVVLVAMNEIVIDQVLAEIQKQVADLPRKGIALAALNKSMAIQMPDEKSAMELLNAYAPEHLILACANADLLAEQVVNAGSVFLGAYSPESAGDYASGTNHTLPTNGFAKAWSGVSLDSFVKKITFQRISETGLKNIGPSVACMAEAEGLQAHKNAVTVRLNQINF
jgi:histidinol dehydrogenase